ncbi:MAG: DUF3618 domain-containing protein [Candidatus Eremiobacteraeota bacterium]|nr:DUF3618 domain-containing protein [Candidatus Eremiobacteraeota bacterium]MBV8366941.1 DUF3618 domain-containing protein [Candidatus Eremiobacteraeota bacterium]
MGKDADQVRREIEDTRDAMGDTVDAIQYRTDVPQRMKDSISDTVDAVKEKAGDVKDKVSESTAGISNGFARLTDSLPDASDIQEGARRVVRAAQDNPLVLAVGAAAVGFLLGVLMPSTSIERERLGPASRRLKEGAAQTGREMLEHGKEVARETAETARISAQRHGQQVMAQVEDRVKDWSDNNNPDRPLS